MDIFRKTNCVKQRLRKPFFLYMRQVKRVMIYSVKITDIGALKMIYSVKITDTCALKIIYAVKITDIGALQIRIQK
jgi:hypothetical protein